MQEVCDQGFAQTLAEVYDQGRDWDLHKAATEQKVLLDALWQALGWRYVGEVLRCSTVLALQRTSDGDLKVRPFKSCKRRWCPVCAWRKSLQQWVKLAERLPDLIERHGPIRWLLLTLTIRNCSINALPAAVDQLLSGFRALTNTKTKLGKEWPATGWLRALEVTFPRPGEAHPHLHVLMAVKPSYFKGGNYISQAEWVQRWRQACKLDYDPVLDIRRVKPLSPAVAEVVGDSLAEALGGLREVSKYVTKPADIAGNPDAARGLMLLKNRRFIDGGGWLRGVFALRDNGLDEQAELPEIESVIFFWWRSVEQRYRRKLESDVFPGSQQPQ